MSQYQVSANCGLESLAEASRRAEEMDLEDNEAEDGRSGQRSPSRIAGQRGKVRKAYTITKQRERWTEEEHDRFLQALKRYGRAWRKIEEHIGTKTAVQIRSHAQKFFSKLQREQSTNGGRDESSKNDINIPPPRPKRKPMHPYPRNSVDCSSEARGDHTKENLGRSSRPEPHSFKNSETTTSTMSTHLPNGNQRSTSSGRQTSQPVISHHSLFQGHHSPYAGGMLSSSQPSQVQLPPFPSLDTSSGENMTKVLKDAAMAAASAWNQVIAGASQKIQYQIQAQSLQPSSLQTVPSVWSMPSFCPEPVEQSPFMRQVLSQLGTQQSAPLSQISQRTGSMPGHAFSPPFSNHSPPGSREAQTTTLPPPKSQHTMGRQEVHDRDTDSQGSEEEGAKLKSSAFTRSSHGDINYWSGNRPWTAVDAEIGRSAWEMMNQNTVQHRATAQTPRETTADDAQASDRFKAPSSNGGSGGARRLMKPIPHSAKIGPLQDQKPNASLLSRPCSDTSQLAHYFQRAAAESQRDSQSPEHYSHAATGVSEGGDNGSRSGNNNRHVQAHKNKLDKGSNNGSGSDDGNGNVIKDNASNGSGNNDTKDSQKALSALKVAKDSTDDLASNAAGPTKTDIPNSDKASNNGSGSGSDEDANANGSDGAAGNEEKGSREGSNSGHASPREHSPTKEVRSLADQNRRETKRTHNKPFSHKSQHPHSAEAAWAKTASLQNQEQALHDARQTGRPTQAEMVQQILPFTLTPQQQQAMTTWAAANSQSQPHQYHLMQSLLNGLTANNMEYAANKANPMLDRQISSLTSADTGSNTEYNAAHATGKSLAHDSHIKQSSCDHPSRPSGFQPYLKRSADSSLDTRPPKRMAGTPLSSENIQKTLKEIPNFDGELKSLPQRKSFTPFGAQSIQGQSLPL